MPGSNATMMASTLNEDEVTFGDPSQLSSDIDSPTAKSFDKRLDRVGKASNPRGDRKTLRLDKNVEEDIQNLSKKYDDKGKLKVQTKVGAGQGMLGGLKNAIGFGNEKKQKVTDVQGQIEKYVENLCQIYSKGTGGRADNVLESQDFLIYPDAQFRVYWDFTMLLLIVYSAIAVPLNLAFESSEEGAFLKVFSLATDLFFITDVILNFFTAYRDGAITVVDRKKIIYRYLTHWFIVDFVASVPLERFTSNSKTGVNKLLRMLRVAKLFRLARLLRYSDSLRAAVHIQPSVVRLIQQMFGIFWMWHIIACGYWSISKDRLGSSDWAPPDSLDDEGESRGESHDYIQSYLWAIETTFSFKVPGRPARTEEAIFSVFVIICGIIMSALVIGTAASALASMDAEAIRRRRALDKVIRYMKKRKLPSYFQRIIVDFHEYMAEKPSQDELMSGLPEPIRLRLSLLLNRDLVKDIPMLKQLSIGPIIGLMQKLSSEIFLPGEFALTAGDVGGYMFFVRSGEMDLLLEDNATIVQSLNEGDMFGHIAVVENCVHNHSVRAVKYSECTSLTQKAYMGICKESEKFEELVTLEAMRQEALINAALKNVTRFAKLGKMGGGSASTEHNDRKRRESVSRTPGSPKPGGGASSPKPGARGAGGSGSGNAIENIAKNVRSGLERSIRVGGSNSGIGRGNSYLGGGGRLSLSGKGQAAVAPKSSEKEARSSFH